MLATVIEHIYKAKGLPGEAAKSEKKRRNELVGMIRRRGRHQVLIPYSRSINRFLQSVVSSLHTPLRLRTIRASMNKFHIITSQESLNKLFREICKYKCE